jgi:uncharacterized phage-associated protein
MFGIMYAKSTAASVANEFLDLWSKEQAYVPAIDQMKIQKLLFYAHGWYLANTDGPPLFEDDFEAWPWGPILRDIYAQTRKFGRNPITERMYEISGNGFGFVTPRGVEDPELKHFVKVIWDAYKDLSGIQLSNLTHAPGEPWAIMKERFGSLDHKPKIPNELIASVFKKKIENAAGNTVCTTTATV